MMRRRPLAFPLLGTALVLTACGGKTNEEPAASTDGGSTSAASTATNDVESASSDYASSVESSPTGAAGSTAAPTEDTSVAPQSSPTEAEDSTITLETDAGPPTPPVVTEPPGPVCPDMCGNSVVDTCEVCSPWPSGGVDPVEPGLPALDRIAPPMDPVCTTLSEQCDGALDTGQSCEAIGFSGGTLSCGSQCRYDDAQCTSCVTALEVTACRDDLAAGEKPSYVALATNTHEVAAAWNEGCEAQVAWFDSALETARTTTLPNAPCVTTTSGIMLAPLADSWVAQVGVEQFVLGADGDVLDARDVAGSALFAAPRLDDTPLVVRQTSYGVVTASLLDETGVEVWTQEVSDNVTEAHYGSATAVADGFLVALRTDAGVQVFHLDVTDGSILGVSTPGGGSTEYPQISAADDQVRLVWADFSGTPRVLWAKLDQGGERLGNVVELGGSPDYFNRSPIIVDGSDTVVVFGGYTGGTGIGQASHARRIDADGSTTAGDIVVQADPNRISWPQVVAFDGAFVTAWVGNGEAGRVGLARIEL